MAVKKELIHQVKKCEGTYEVCYTDEGIPYLHCQKCHYELKDWIKWEEEYKDFCSQDEKWSSKKDHLMCILSYFCYKYLEFYKTPYLFPLSEKGLFKSAEINIIRRIYSTFKSDPLKVKEYIDWYFETQVHKRKRKILSLSFLAASWCLNDFAHSVRQSKRITRDKALPESLVKIVDKMFSSITERFQFVTYGDLYFLMQYFYALKQEDKPEDLSRLFAALEKKGLVRDQKIVGWAND